MKIIPFAVKASKSVQAVVIVRNSAGLKRLCNAKLHKKKEHDQQMKSKRYAVADQPVTKS
jgi:hypothetical protein